jgi:hypothetical protein
MQYYHLKHTEMAQSFFSIYQFIILPTLACSFTAFILRSAAAMKLPMLLFYNGQRLLHAHDCQSITLEELFVE